MATDFKTLTAVSLILLLLLGAFLQFLGLNHALIGSQVLMLLALFGFLAYQLKSKNQKKESALEFSEYINRFHDECSKILPTVDDIAVFSPLGLISKNLQKEIPVNTPALDYLKTTIDDALISNTPLKIYISGDSGVGRTTISLQLGAHYSQVRGSKVPMLLPVHTCIGKSKSKDLIERPYGDVDARQRWLWLCDLEFEPDTDFWRDLAPEIESCIQHLPSNAIVVIFHHTNHHNMLKSFLGYFKLEDTEKQKLEKLKWEERTKHAQPRQSWEDWEKFERISGVDSERAIEYINKHSISQKGGYIVREMQAKGLLWPDNNMENPTLLRCIAELYDQSPEIFHTPGALVKQLLQALFSVKQPGTSPTEMHEKMQNIAVRVGLTNRAFWDGFSDSEKKGIKPYLNSIVLLLDWNLVQNNPQSENGYLRFYSGWFMYYYRAYAYLHGKLNLEDWLKNYSTNSQEWLCLLYFPHVNGKTEYLEHKLHDIGRPLDYPLKVLLCWLYVANTGRLIYQEKVHSEFLQLLSKYKLDSGPYKYEERLTPHAKRLSMLFTHSAYHFLQTFGDLDLGSSNHISISHELSQRSDPVTEGLERQLKDLTEEYKKASEQQGRLPNEVDQLRNKRQLAAIEEKLSSVTTQLNAKRNRVVPSQSNTELPAAKLTGIPLNQHQGLKDLIIFLSIEDAGFVTALFKIRENMRSGTGFSEPYILYPRLVEIMSEATRRYLSKQGSDSLWTAPFIDFLDLSFSHSTKLRPLTRPWAGYALIHLHNRALANNDRTAMQKRYPELLRTAVGQTEVDLERLKEFLWTSEDDRVLANDIAQQMRAISDTGV